MWFETSFPTHRGKESSHCCELLWHIAVFITLYGVVESKLTGKTSS